MGGIIINKIKLHEIFVIIIMCLLLTISFFPAIQSHELQYKNLKLDNKNEDRIPVLKQIGPVGTYEDYITNREQKPYFIEKIIESPVRTSTPLIIVFIEEDIVTELTDEISLYHETLLNVGYNSVVYEVSGVETEDIKDTILTYWEDGKNVEGTVLIGDLPVEWFHHENDFYGSSEFPCDLYLMDLDGDWTDTDSDGMYDLHTDGSGDTAPEIYTGRIDASNIPGDEITNLKKYFAKVDDFWSRNTQQTELGLTYTDEDWASYDSFRYDIGYAYEDYEAIWYPDVERNDYVNNRIPSIYEFIQLSCHSSSQGHAFTQGGWAYNNEIRNAPPKALFYNLFCCSSLRFTEYDCLGYAYILDTETPSLSVVGSTKTGSMLDFRYFYEPIGNGSSFGTALKEWFEYEYPYDDDPSGYNDISWFYGLVILGDPTLIIKNQPPYGSNFTGPETGYAGGEYDFCLNAVDPNDDTIFCIYDWDDGTDSGWLGPYYSGDLICASHKWDEPGEYFIRFKLKDSKGYEISWSEPNVITIFENLAPENPTISGPDTGKPKELQRFTVSSTDPEGHDLFYFISWGDGNYDYWDGPYVSGEEVEFGHSWSEKGEYTIQVKTRDMHGAESDWTTQQITMPRNKMLFFNIFQRKIFARFPNTLPIIQFLNQRLNN